MEYVFTFLGEFGYELLNWQGVVRKFQSTLGPDDKVICCGRPGLGTLYETADAFIDISECVEYRESIACGYYGLHPDDRDHRSRRNLRFDRRLRSALKRFINKSLSGREGRWPLRSFRRRFVFSSDHLIMNGVKFGCNRERWVTDAAEGDIYDLLDTGNNQYRKLNSPLTARDAIEGALGGSLSEPFVLCQARERTMQRSTDVMPKEQLIAALAERMRVVLLSFRTGRLDDSYSRFAQIANCYEYDCRSFEQQTCLISLARHCVFFTEGDFGSHIYVPPLLGKDVHAVAPESVYQLGTTPTDYWNREVFRFGGQIRTWSAEAVFGNADRIEHTVDLILDS